MNRSINNEDMLFHALFIGSTGAGKTNALLYWLRRLFSNRKDVALVLIDPHGDAAIDLVRLIPKSERERITILDPTYVSFGLNPLSLPAGTEARTGSRYSRPRSRSSPPSSRTSSTPTRPPPQG